VLYMNTSSHQLVLTDFLVFIVLHVLTVCCVCVCVFILFFLPLW